MVSIWSILIKLQATILAIPGRLAYQPSGCVLGLNRTEWRRSLSRSILSLPLESIILHTMSAAFKSTVSLHGSLGASLLSLFSSQSFRFTFKCSKIISVNIQQNNDTWSHFVCILHVEVKTRVGNLPHIGLIVRVWDVFEIVTGWILMNSLVSNERKACRRLFQSTQTIHHIAHYTPWCWCNPRAWCVDTVFSLNNALAFLRHSNSSSCMGAAAAKTVDGGRYRPGPSILSKL